MKFRSDNTEGYDLQQLDRLNAIWERTSRLLSPDDLDYKSHCDYLAERILADFDAGKFGPER
jgi:hypothetical protein